MAMTIESRILFFPIFGPQAARSRGIQLQRSTSQYIHNVNGCKYDLILFSHLRRFNTLIFLALAAFVMSSYLLFCILCGIKNKTTWSDIFCK